MQGARTPKQHRTSFSSRKLTGRPSYNQSTASLHSLSSQISNFRLDSTEADDAVPDQTETPEVTDDPQALLSKVANWLHEEKAKRISRRLGGAKEHAYPRADAQKSPNLASRPRSDSQASETALALERLERILAGYAALGKEKVKEKRLSHSSRRPPSIRKLKRGSTVAGSSDTEYQDGDALVPNVEAVLDNSKTMAYAGGGSVEDAGAEGTAKRSKDKKNWDAFKTEIVRLTHTLRLKGWRRVPMEQGAEIKVERLSGALTNAVYVVSPPKNLLQGLPQTLGTDQEAIAPSISKRTPS